MNVERENRPFGGCYVLKGFCFPFNFCEGGGEQNEKNQDKPFREKRWNVKVF